MTHGEDELHGPLVVALKFAKMKTMKHGNEKEWFSSGYGFIQMGLPSKH